jgi:hypothetical protein
MIWVFVTILLWSNGEVATLRSQPFATWEACEQAVANASLLPLPKGAEGRILRPCRAEEKP